LQRAAQQGRAREAGGVADARVACDRGARGVQGETRADHGGLHVDAHAGEGAAGHGVRRGVDEEQDGAEQPDGEGRAGDGPGAPARQSHDGATGQGEEDEGMRHE